MIKPDNKFLSILLDLLIWLMLAVPVGVVMVSMAEAQELKVSTGGPQGTYSRMFKELNVICGSSIVATELNSSGSVQNMDRIIGNEVNAAIVQTDVLFYRARNENLSGIKTLFSLHPEEVHVITPAQSPIREGGVAGIGAKPIQLNTVNDLAGRVVVATGGSYITAQVIRLQAEIGFSVVEVPDFKALKTAIDLGQAAAGFVVGGQPMADVANLGRGYRILPFPEATVARLKSVYAPAKVTYSGMGPGGSGIPTVSTDALFVTREYRSARFSASLMNLRKCFKDNVVEISETTGTHRAWTTVNPDNPGKWSYYQPGGTVSK